MRLSYLSAALGIIAASSGAIASDDVSPRADMTRTTASEESRASVHSWEMPALTVEGRSSGILREEDRIGSYAQPRWTARRRWTEVRSYVIPEGQIEFEYWLIVKEPKDRDATRPVKVQQVYEVEIGLPYRFQIDLYQVYQKTGSSGANELDETKFELRYALADWGKIWANPTLYGEWVAVSGDYDVAEFKLLLCDEIAPRWHWAANLVYEQRLGGDRFISREIKPALAYTVLDEKLSIGAEAKFAWEDVEGDRGNYQREILVGPSIQVRPLPQMHLDASYLMGVTDQSLASKTALILGWEF
ncbi:MAG: hypothetical protein H0V44_13840 [Planctomycetes bacterium]|nr:hypothetical protein [Planctomycetota bacterium]